MRPIQNELLQAVRALDRRFESNLATGYVEKLVDEFYAPEARVLPPNQPAVVGREAVAKLWGAMLPAVKRLTLDTTHAEASGDLAWGTGQYSLTLQMAPGQTITDAGKYVVVYRKHDGEWLAVADIWNSDRPAA